MRICVVLEGCYPYVTGGVSSWIHDYMRGMPEHEFVVWAIGASSKDRGKFKYQLPDNVVEVKEVFLNDAFREYPEVGRHKYTEQEMAALKNCINCKPTDWEVLFRLYQGGKVTPQSFLMSEEFLELISDICEEEYPYTAFSALFHTVRSMLLPLLYIIQSEVPKADLYHSIATGYGGILARLGSYMNHVPFMITEHGIYTREREEEIIRAKWVDPAFKKFWVRFFYMLSDGAYKKATMVTSLFKGAMETQIDIGCDRDKCRFIINGIRYERFENIEPKEDNGYIDVGAVLRIAPIKDVKTMIYAFAKMKEAVPNARLFIAGPEDDKEYAQECYTLIKRLKVEDIIFLGTVNVVEYLGKFDFTILTSISEGMPLSVMESFAAGVPCVTTDVGSCKQLLNSIAEEDDLGVAGYCVPPMHQEGVANAMIQMALQTEERKKMAKIARKRADLFFRHEDMMKKYREAYDEVFRRWQG